MLASRLLPPQLILPPWTLCRQCHPRWLHDPKGSWARWEGDRLPKPQEPRQEGYKHVKPKRHKFEQVEVNPREPRQPESRLQELKKRKPRHQSSKHQEPRHPEPKHEELSLFEELFPEEAKNQLNNERTPDNTEHHVPRLPLPDLDQVEDQDGNDSGQGRSKGLTKAASRAAFRQWNLAILVLRRASISLNDSDFRHIAPKGQHIDDWKGPGDPLKGTTS